MAFAEQLTDFMDATTGFAQDVTVGGVAGVGIFDVPTRDVLGLVQNTDPALIVIGSAFPSAAVGDAVVTGGTTYTVTGIYPDGTGLTKLVLK